MLRNRHYSLLSSFGTSSVAKNSARAKPIAHQLSIEFGIGANGTRNKKRGESNRASGRPTYEANDRKCTAIKVRADKIFSYGKKQKDLNSMGSLCYFDEKTELVED